MRPQVCVFANQAISHCPIVKVEVYLVWFPFAFEQAGFFFGTLNKLAFFIAVVIQNYGQNVLGLGTRKLREYIAIDAQKSTSIAFKAIIL